MKRCVCILLATLLCAALLLPAGAAVRGDVDGDGVLSAADARIALRRSVALETFLPGSGKFHAADADGDGVVTAGDARSLLRRSVGLADEAAVEPPAAGEVTAAFSLAQTGFGLSLLQSQTAGKQDNVLLSPVSAAYALAMVVNGAVGETQKELLDAVGMPDADTLNAQLYALHAALPQEENCRLSVANSLWVNERVQPFVETPFLRTTLRYFNAGLNVCGFNDDALPMINGWVSENTDGMIDRIVSTLDPATAVLLINALCMDADWEKPFSETSVYDAPFAAADGQTVEVKMMRGTAPLYLENDEAVGFIRPYAGGKLQFAAILPKTEGDINAFLHTLDAHTLHGLLTDAEAETVTVQMPKFTFAYDASLRTSLEALGVRGLFDPAQADLSAMLRPPVTAYADDVIQKTFIEVNTEGTRAAAVTAVIIKSNAIPPWDQKVVVLDRPFLFVITAGEQNVPVFIGVVANPAA